MLWFKHDHILNSLHIKLPEGEQKRKGVQLESGSLWSESKQFKLFSISFTAIRRENLVQFNRKDDRSYGKTSEKRRTFRTSNTYFLSLILITKTYHKKKKKSNRNHKLNNLNATIFNITLSLNSHLYIHRESSMYTWIGNINLHYRSVFITCSRWFRVLQPWLA